MSDPCCKVDSTTVKHDLEEGIVSESLDEYLTGRWKGQRDYPETGIRPLTAWFNKRILRAVYAAHDRRTVENRIDADYEALTGDDELARGAVLDDLREDGIDGEELIDDFVSSATLYRHLTDHLGAVKPKPTRPDSNWERDKVDYVRNTMRKNVEDSLRSLENKGRLPRATSAEISASILLGCPECSTRVPFDRAVKRGYICEEHMTRSPHSDTETVSSAETAQR